MKTVKKGQFVIVNPETITQDRATKGGSSTTFGGDVEELETPPTDIEAPDFNPDADVSGVTRTERTFDGKTGETNKVYGSKKSDLNALGKGGSKEKISTKWALNVSSALSGGRVSEEMKKLIKGLIEKGKAKVNWKKELKKFVNQASSKMVEVLPNRRFLSSGTVLYGSKREGADTIRTLACCIDTSASISKSQTKVFLEEVWSLTTRYDINRMVIIYCSDSIDGVEILKKGKTPDLSKWATTGGNAGGFDPPFKWLQDNKIKPTVLIYLTDSFASYPSTSKYGIDKYKDRVFWFICNATNNFDKPPFGRYIHVPMDGKGNFL
jgi:predicted metal-dependent peptidase